MPGTIASIGCGNMGSALLSGLARVLSKDDYRICAYDIDPQKLIPLKALGIEPMPDVASLVRAADILLLAVKPHQVAKVLGEARPYLEQAKTVLSIAAGISLSTLNENVHGLCPVARLLPTTTALVGQGIFAFCCADAGSSALPKVRREELTGIFVRLGLCLTLPESKFMAFTALIGAGPAYVFAMMQGLVQAGVTIGFGHAETRELISELFSGCAKMAKETQKPLSVLRDEVCSPGGLTIAGVNVLDRAGMSGLIVEAVQAAEQRGFEMERQI